MYIFKLKSKVVR